MNVLTEITRPWLALSLIPGIGSATLRAIHASGQWDRRGSSLLELAHEFDIPRLAKALETPGVLRKAELDADAQVKMAIRYGARIISALDAEFPSLLKESRYNPFLLFVRGELAADNTPSVAIVGTRKPTRAGKALAKELGREAGENGWSVVSGLAIGCDAEAHQGALDAKGHTIAVMAHGLHTIEPHRNADLGRSILDNGGALVSHFAFGVAAEPKYFVQRDAIQAGLGQGVALIQSDVNGGSLHAARAALADQRWLWAAPISPDDLEREQTQVQEYREAAAVIRANEILRTGTEAEKRDLLRLKEGASLAGILGNDAPFPARKSVGIEAESVATTEVEEDAPSGSPGAHAPGP